ncbi:MAG: chromosome segregation SMC family protein, partial [bacterium]
MLLKSIEMFGFKSFPRKTRIRLDSGITALVGPNGCGKSNIVDAIRWALGEQRPNTLRCDRMPDIIFGGTQNRRSLGLAEVTLTFVNDGKLSLDFEEVEVTRRLYRSGESEYLLNRAPCRHKDIVDLFLNTGLSSKAYAMITVDMVDRILKSDPQLRRNFFEEAAGISKYRATRNLALRRLCATEEDLVRVNDIIIEIERTCRSLKRQAGRARSYRCLKQELKGLEAAHLVTKFEQLREARDKLKEQKAKLESSRNSTMEDLAVREDEFRKKKEELKEKELEYSTLLARLEKTREDVNRIERDLAMFRERKKSLQESLDRLTRDRFEIERRIPNVEEQVEAARTELDQLGHSIETAESRLEEKNNCLKRAEEEVSSLLLREEDITDKLKEVYTEENHKRKTYFALEAQEEAHLDRLEGLCAESKDLEDQLRLYSWHLHQGIDQVNSFSATLRTYEDKLEEFRRVMEDARRSRNALAEREGELRQKLLTAKSELDLLKLLEERMEGHRASARVLLGRKNPGSRYSTLADSIEVPDEYAQAIEGALEIGLSTLITENEEEAVASIQFLKKNKKGRAAFAPLSLLRSPPAPPAPVKDSIVWLASDFVKCDKVYTPVIKAILGRFILCEDLQTALKMFKRGSYPQFYLLTRSGEVIEPTGVIKGGSRAE